MKEALKILAAILLPFVTAGLLTGFVVLTEGFYLWGFKSIDWQAMRGCYMFTLLLSVLILPCFYDVITK